ETGCARSGTHAKPLVPGKGLEPLHLAAADFESAASTDSAIPAGEAHYPRTSVIAASAGGYLSRPSRPAARPFTLTFTAMSLTLDDFAYRLPPERIAQAPLAERSASRLLVVTPACGTSPLLADASIADLPALVRPGDLLVFNDTRVIHARL